MATSPDNNSNASKTTPPPLKSTTSTSSLVTPTLAIELIRKGGTLLKCGRSGPPHFRFFQLSEDSKQLVWTSPKKKGGYGSVVLAEATELRFGQKTSVFNRQKIREYEAFSFSLIYGAQGNTLDIVCKDKREFEIWSIGLKAIIDINCGRDVPIIDSSVTIPFDEEEERLQVTFKGKSTVLIKKENSYDVYTWGEGANGRLGHGDETDQYAPKVVQALLGKEVKMIDCGLGHSACVTLSGEVYTWGAGGSGRLGHGHERDRFSPLQVTALKAFRVMSVSCGYYHTAAVLDTGAVYTWGKAADGRLGISQEVEANQSTPQMVTALEKVKIKRVECSSNFTYAISVDNVIYSWGGNEHGQLGHGDTASRPLPTQLSFFSNNSSIEIRSIALGIAHVVVVTEDGSVYNWGDGSKGKLGHGDETTLTTPRRLSGFGPKMIENAKDAAAGDYTTVILTESGRVYSMGEGSNGQLGQGTATSFINLPLCLSKTFDSRIVNVSMRANHVAAVSENGNLWSWGLGVHGRLGHNDVDDQKIPKQVESMSGKKVFKGACGGSHTAVLIARSWVPDEESKKCMHCSTTFTFINRRHHCRNCGGIFCGSCSSKKFPLLKDGFKVPVRVCSSCHTSLTSST